MSNIFLIHGSHGHPKNNWFPWLKAELKKLGHTVFIPHFPTPKNQTLDHWLKVFKKYEKHIDKNTIFIGHSLGAPFILNLFEKIKKPVKSTFLVAGFTGLLKSKKFDPLIKTFSDRKFNWQKLKQKSQKFHVFHSNNDPYVPLAKGRQLAKNLKAKLTLIKNAGHFNSESKWLQFKQLLRKIKK